MRILLIFAMALAFIDGTLAVIFPVLFAVFKNKFHCDIEQLGRIQFIFNISQLFFCVFAVWLVNKIGFVKILFGAFIFSISGLLIISIAPDYNSLLIGVIILGLSHTAYCGIGSTIITNCFKVNQGMIFFIFGVMISCGSIGSSTALGKWMDHSMTSDVYWGIGIWAIAALLVLFFGMLFIFKRNIEFIDNVNFKREFKTVKKYEKLFKDKGIFSIFTALLIYAIAYIGILTWIGQLYQKSFNLGVGQTAYIASLYLVGFLFGRVVFFLLAKKVRSSPMVLIFICALASTVTLVLSITTNNLLLGKAMILLSGIFLSAIVPGILSAVGDLFESDNSYPAYNLFMAVLAVSYGFGPYFIGLLGNLLTLERSIWIAPAFSLVLVFIAFNSIKTSRQNEKIEKIVPEYKKNTC